MSARVGHSRHSARHTRPVCGRGYETYTDDELAFLSSNGQPPSLEWSRQNFNLVSTQNSPIVVMRNGTRTFEAFRWGLVPFWAKTVQAASKYSLINARGEEVAEKRTYARLFQRRRCVVALSGFYEWRREDRTKPPFAIHLQDRSVMCVAGVWDRWQPAGEPDPTFARLLPPSWRRVTPKRPTCARCCSTPSHADPTATWPVTPDKGEGLDDMMARRAPVAQLDRAPGFEPVGRGFKSLRAHHFLRTFRRSAGVFL